MSYRRLVVVLAVLGVVAAACSNATSDTTQTSDPTDSVQADTAEPSSDTTTSTQSGSQSSESGQLTIEDGDTVEVHYVGTLDDGSQFDSSRDPDRSPLSFTVGTGQVISGFDLAVLGAKVGDVTTTRMEPIDAYGEWTEDRVIEVPFNPEQGDVQVGEEVFLTNGQPATVLEVTGESVTLDANHPLAGEALTFEIEILSVTKGS